MARNLVFPSKSNRTYRAGYVKLTAFGSEWDESKVQGSTASLVESFKNTARVWAEEFEPDDPLQYLANAKQNMEKERKQMQGTVKFTAILPLPLAIRDQTGIEWASTSSAFIDGMYGKINKAGVGTATTVQGLDKVAGAAGQAMDSAFGGNYGARGADWARQNLGAYLATGLNPITEATIKGSSSIFDSVANSPAAQSIIGPNNVGTGALIGMQSDAAILDFHREAAALSGVRQVIFDPGYWQSFKGVNPRQFTLSWDIIPESHEDALRGLEFCARIKEHSLPQAVSSVELASPCYWQLDWSNNLLDAQTLYSNLVITDFQVDYAQNGEWHGASTPKQFKITIAFSEAKAPTNNIYKKSADFLPVTSSSAGGTAGSKRISSKGSLNIGGGSGSSSSGSLGSLGSGLGGLSGVLGNVGSQISGTVNNAISGVTKALAAAAAGAAGSLSQTLGNATGAAVGSVFGDKVGAIASDTISNAASGTSQAVIGAISSGNITNLGDTVKNAAIAAAAGTAGQQIGDAVKPWIESGKEWIGDIVGKVEDVVPGTDAKKEQDANSTTSSSTASPSSSSSN